MGRWKPNASARLQAAAMELFVERGYDRTTVGDIAARAKLAERTFFRYFGDRREVLFAGAAELEKHLVASVAGAPRTMTPLEVVAAALAAMSPVFEGHRAIARKRQALIAAHAELQERELIKSARLATTMAAGLRARGVPAATADLVALSGMVLFQTAFAGWVDDARKRDLAHHVHAALAELRRVTGDVGAAKGRRTPSPTRGTKQ